MDRPGFLSLLCSIDLSSIRKFLPRFGLFWNFKQTFRLKIRNCFLHALAWQCLLLMSQVNLSFILGGMYWYQPMDRLSVFPLLTANLAFLECAASPGSTTRSCPSISLASQESFRHCLGFPSVIKAQVYRYQDQKCFVGSGVLLILGSLGPSLSVNHNKAPNHRCGE